jgi:hypothetical protein
MAVFDPNYDDVLLLVWHGVPGDDHLWSATRSAILSGPSGWSAPQMSGITSTGGPGVAQLGNFAYQGAPGSKQAYLFSASYSLQGTGGPAAPIAGPSGPFQSATRPALGGLYADWPVLAWRRLTDGATVTSARTQNGWTSEVAVGRTSHAPAVSSDGQLLVWKDADGPQMKFSVRNGGGWSGQQQLIPVGGAVLTTAAPALAQARGGDSYRWAMAWRGLEDTGQIYWSTSRAQGWNDAIPAIPKSGAIWTSDGPAIYRWRGGLTMAWKGVNGDARLWWSDFDPAAGKWEIPQVVAGANSDSGPGLGGVTEVAFDTDQ